jgi:hypothetical protein
VGGHGSKRATAVSEARAAVAPYINRLMAADLPPRSAPCDVGAAWETGCEDGPNPAHLWRFDARRAWGALTLGSQVPATPRCEGFNSGAH